MKTNISTTEDTSTKSFNYRLTEFFINKSRLTVLALVLLVVIGGASVALNKLSGFPEIEVKLAIIGARYQGASATTVLQDVTEPIESVLDNVDGITTYSSTSLDSFSSVVVSIEESASSDKVRSDIQNELSSVSFPDGVDPKITVPSTGGPDMILNVVANNKEELYALYNDIRTEILSLDGASEVESIVELDKKVIIEFQSDKLTEYGLNIQTVQSQLATLGDSAPVASGIDIDGSRSSVFVDYQENEDEYEALKSFPIQIPAATSVAQAASPQGFTPPAPVNAQFVSLSQIAQINEDYFYVNDRGAIIEDGISFYGSTQQNGVSEPQEALSVVIKSKEGTNLSEFETQVMDAVKSVNNTTYVEFPDLQDAELGSTYVVESYSVDSQNQKQVNQIIQGLLGGTIGDQWWRFIGYLFGALFLVFLVMLIFVSWRSALIATVSIPLSIMFAGMYIYATGATLNFLVLFSVVLVIGLVVDPTLVILEAIQSKMDTGLKGKEAVLAAVREVGDGLFSSTLTNIVVFAPFGVISGFIGQIFGYIPATVIPAIAGSYIVALVFLAWLGSLFLKKSKGEVKTEEETLWPISRWLISFNTRILEGSRTVRLLIIVLGLAIPLGVTGILFANEKINSVQFARDLNGVVMDVSYEYLPSATTEQRIEVNKDIVQTLAQYQPVIDVTSFAQQGQGYYVNLLPANERKGEYAEINTLEFADKVSQDLRNTFVGNDDSVLFDVNASAVTTGPPTASFQIALAITESNTDTLETASLEVGKTLEHVCKDGNSYSVNFDCADENKVITRVDNGFTDKQSDAIAINLIREKIGQSSSASSTPFSQVQQTSFVIAAQLSEYSTFPVTSINKDGEDLDVLIRQTPDPIDTADAIETIGVPTAQSFNTLNNVAEIEVTSPKASIQRLDGETINQVRGRLIGDLSANQGAASAVTQAVIDYYAENDFERSRALNLEDGSIDIYQEGDTASVIKSFQELGLALLLAIFLIYTILVIFFDSFTSPIVILFTIPLTFLGVFPALAFIGSGEFGFLEIIGIIILAGLVVNVAIYLIDTAKQRMDEGWEVKKAIAHASGLRFRAVLLTNLTAIASLAPLSITSEFYRSISLTIIFGLTTSALTSLVTTPILYTFFQWSSKNFHEQNSWLKVLSVPLFPIFWIYWGIRDFKW